MVLQVRQAETMTVDELVSPDDGHRHPWNVEFLALRLEFFGEPGKALVQRRRRRLRPGLDGSASPRRSQEGRQEREDKQSSPGMKAGFLVHGPVSEQGGFSRSLQVPG